MNLAFLPFVWQTLSFSPPLVLTKYLKDASLLASLSAPYTNSVVARKQNLLIVLKHVLLVFFFVKVAAILRNMQELEESPTGSGNAFIYGNDVDSVDIAIRVAMVRLYFYI